MNDLFINTLARPDFPDSAVPDSPPQAPENDAVNDPPLAIKHPSNVSPSGIVAGLVGTNGTISKALALYFKSKGHTTLNLPLDGEEELESAPEKEPVHPRLAELGIDHVDVIFVPLYSLEPFYPPLLEGEYLQIVRKNAKRYGAKRVVFLVDIQASAMDGAVAVDISHRIQDIFFEDITVPISIFRTSTVIHSTLAFVRAVALDPEKISVPVGAEKNTCEPVYLLDLCAILEKSFYHNLGRPYYFDISGTDRVTYPELIQAIKKSCTENTLPSGIQKNDAVTHAIKQFPSYALKDASATGERAEEYFTDVSLTPLSDILKQL